MDPKSRRCIFIGYRADEYRCRFWDPENRKILRYKDMIFNEQKTYKDLQTEWITSKDDPMVALRSTPEQQGITYSKFIEFEDASVDKAQNILEKCVESRVATMTPKLSRGTQPYKQRLHKDILLPYTIY